MSSFQSHFGLNATKWVVRAGEHNIFDEHYEDSQIERIITHPDDGTEGVFMIREFVRPLCTYSLKCVMVITS